MADLPAQEREPAATTPAKPNSSPLAIVSVISGFAAALAFVSGVIAAILITDPAVSASTMPGGVFLCFVFAVIGVVTGAIAFNRITRSAGRLGGRGWAVSGLTVSIMSLGLALLIGAFFTLALWAFMMLPSD